MNITKFLPDPVVEIEEIASVMNEGGWQRYRGKTDGGIWLRTHHPNIAGEIMVALYPAGRRIAAVAYRDAVPLLEVQADLDSDVNYTALLPELSADDENVARGIAAMLHMMMTPERFRHVFVGMTDPGGGGVA